MIVDYGQVLAFRHELARDAMLGALSPARRAALMPWCSVPSKVLRPDSRIALASRTTPKAPRTRPRCCVTPPRPRGGPPRSGHIARRPLSTSGPRPSGALALKERASLLEALAHECSLTAQVEQALAAREAALDIWRARGDRHREGENRCHLALLLWADARMDEANQEAATAVAILEALPPGRELALAYGTLARLRGTTLNDAEAIDLGEPAIALAESIGAIETLADALITVGVARLARELRARPRSTRAKRRALDARWARRARRPPHQFGIRLRRALPVRSRRQALHRRHSVLRRARSRSFPATHDCPARPLPALPRRLDSRQ